MTAEERRAERFDPRDADPLTVEGPTVFSDADKLRVLALWFDMWDRPETNRQAILDDGRHPGKNDVQRDLRRIANGLDGRRDRETREEFRSGAVVLYLAVILAIVAGAAIAWLWWTFR